MPATITATGTFTDLIGLGVIAPQGTYPAATGFPPGGLNRPPQGARGNEPDIQDYNLDALKTMDGVTLDELRQFIQLIATAYGLNYWQGASLVQTLLRAHMQTDRTTTMLGDTFGPRLYVP